MREPVATRTHMRL